MMHGKHTKTFESKIKFSETVSDGVGQGWHFFKVSCTFLVWHALQGVRCAVFCAVLTVVFYVRERPAVDWHARGSLMD